MKVGSLDVRFVSDRDDPDLSKVVVSNGFGDSVSSSIKTPITPTTQAEALMRCIMAWWSEVEKRAEPSLDDAISIDEALPLR